MLCCQSSSSCTVPCPRKSRCHGGVACSEHGDSSSRSSMMQCCFVNCPHTTGLAVAQTGNLRLTMNSCHLSRYFKQTRHRPHPHLHVPASILAAGLIPCSMMGMCTVYPLGTVGSGVFPA